MSTEEYEYLVEKQQIGTDRWGRAGVGEWTDEASALRRFKTFVEIEDGIVEYGGKKRYIHRIVRRAVSPVTVYVEEGDVV